MRKRGHSRIRVPNEPDGPTRVGGVPGGRADTESVTATSMVSDERFVRPVERRPVAPSGGASNADTKSEVYQVLVVENLSIQERLLEVVSNSVIVRCLATGKSAGAVVGAVTGGDPRDLRLTVYADTGLVQISDKGVIQLLCTTLRGSPYPLVSLFERVFQVKHDVLPQVLSIVRLPLATVQQLWGRLRQLDNNAECQAMSPPAPLVQSLMGTPGGWMPPPDARILQADGPNGEKRGADDFDGGDTGTPIDALEAMTHEIEVLIAQRQPDFVIHRAIHAVWAIVNTYWTGGRLSSATAVAKAVHVVLGLMPSIAQQSNGVTDDAARVCSTGIENLAKSWSLEATRSGIESSFARSVATVLAHHVLQSSTQEQGMRSTAPVALAAMNSIAVARAVTQSMSFIVSPPGMTLLLSDIDVIVRQGMNSASVEARTEPVKDITLSDSNECFQQLGSRIHVGSWLVQCAKRSLAGCVRSFFPQLSEALLVAAKEDVDRALRRESPVAAAGGDGTVGGGGGGEPPAVLSMEVMRTVWCGGVSALEVIRRILDAGSMMVSPIGVCVLSEENNPREHSGKTEVLQAGLAKLTEDACDLLQALMTISYWLPFLPHGDGVALPVRAVSTSAEYTEYVEKRPVSDVVVSMFTNAAPVICSYFRRLPAWCASFAIPTNIDITVGQDYAWERLTEAAFSFTVAHGVLYGISATATTGTAHRLMPLDSTRGGAGGGAATTSMGAGGDKKSASAAAVLPLSYINHSWLLKLTVGCGTTGPRSLLGVLHRFLRISIAAGKRSAHHRRTVQIIDFTLRHVSSVISSLAAASPTPSPLTAVWQTMQCALTYGRELVSGEQHFDSRRKLAAILLNAGLSYRAALRLECWSMHPEPPSVDELDPSKMKSEFIFPEITNTTDVSLLFTGAELQTSAAAVTYLVDGLLRDDPHLQVIFARHCLQAAEVLSKSHAATNVAMAFAVSGLRVLQEGTEEDVASVKVNEFDALMWGLCKPWAALKATCPVYSFDPDQGSTTERLLELDDRASNSHAETGVGASPAVRSTPLLAYLSSIYD